MAEVMAGFVCGYALALIATPVAAIAMVRARARSAAVEQVVPTGTPIVAVSVLIHTFAFLVLTAAGLLLGMLLMGLEDSRPASGIGSPNAVFTVIILAMTAIAFIPPLAIRPSWRVPLVATAMLFAVTFGWAMPYLSLLGPE